MMYFSASASTKGRFVSLLAFGRSVVLMTAGCWLVGSGLSAHALGSLRAGAMSGMGGSSSATATSQTATTATNTTSQTVTASAGAQQAQASLNHSIQALQALQAAQASARRAAINSSANNLGLNPINPGQTLPNVTDGLGGGSGLTGGLVPAGATLTTTTTPSIQIIKLGGAGNNSLNLTSGGTVVVPEGTTGTDSVSISGAGSVTASSGSVTANTGSVTTQYGATLSSLQGGSITLAGSGSLSIVTTTKLTSNAAGYHRPR